MGKPCYPTPGGWRGSSPWSLSLTEVRDDRFSLSQTSQMLLYVLEELNMGPVQTLAPRVRRVKGRGRALAVAAGRRESG